MAILNDNPADFRYTLGWNEDVSFWCISLQETSKNYLRLSIIWVFDLFLFNWPLYIGNARMLVGSSCAVYLEKCRRILRWAIWQHDEPTNLFFRLNTLCTYLSGSNLWYLKELPLCWVICKIVILYSALRILHFRYLLQCTKFCTLQ